MAERGRLISLEGGEGAGKTTLAKALAAALPGEIVLTRQPGGTPIGAAIRALLVQPQSRDLAPLSEALLFAADRIEHVRQVIAPALARGALVICDRYVDSTRAYQGGGHGVPAAALSALESLVAAPAPDLTFILDAPPELGLKRSRGAALGEDRFEALDLAFHQRVRAAFLAIAAAEPQRCILLDAGLPAEAVAAAALESLRARSMLSP